MSMARLNIYPAFVILACFSASMCSAQMHDWPSEITIGGFTITGIQGSIKADGSGSASGTLQMPIANNPRISLNRSARGDVTGNTSISARLSGYEIHGNFVLDNSGLRGRGSMKTSARPILDASFTVDRAGQFSGTGRMELEAINMPIRFTIGPGGASLSGSASVRTQADTPLASYAFSGELTLNGSPGRLLITAAGTVQRTGKLTNQVTSWTVSNVLVDPSTGIGRVSVDGVNVTFDFFRR